MKVDVCRVIEDGKSGRFLGTVELDDTPERNDILNMSFGLVGEKDIGRWRVVSREFFARKYHSGNPNHYIQTTRNMAVGIIPASFDECNDSDKLVLANLDRIGRIE